MSLRGEPVEEEPEIQESNVIMTSKFHADSKAAFNELLLTLCRLMYLPHLDIPVGYRHCWTVGCHFHCERWSSWAHVCVLDFVDSLNTCVHAREES